MSMFGDNLHNYRKIRGYTQSELAHKIGTAASIISSYERGVVEPSMLRVQQISRVLDIPSYKLTGENVCTNVCNNISRQRIMRGFSKTDLSKMIGIDVELLKDYEDGKEYPPLTTLKKIADCLKVNISDLVEKSKQSNIIGYLENLGYVIKIEDSGVVLSREGNEYAIGSDDFRGLQAHLDKYLEFLVNDFRRNSAKTGMR